MFYLSESSIILSIAPHHNQAQFYVILVKEYFLFYKSKLNLANSVFESPKYILMMVHILFQCDKE